MDALWPIYGHARPEMTRVYNETPERKPPLLLSIQYNDALLPARYTRGPEAGAIVPLLGILGKNHKA
jgi:hypothetical protein